MQLFWLASCSHSTVFAFFFSMNFITIGWQATTNPDQCDFVYLCRLPLENFEQAISPSVRKALQQNGFAIVDGVFGAQWAGRLRSEIQSLRDSGQLHLNCTHLVKNGATELLEKSSIFEAELRSLVSCASLPPENLLPFTISPTIKY